MRKVDLTELSWHRNDIAGSSVGSLYKATQLENGVCLYYKLSRYMGGRLVGHEAINEVIVSRLLDVLELEHTSYDLIDAAVSIKGITFRAPVCVCEEYKHDDEEAIPFCDLFEEESLEAYEWCHTNGFGSQIDTQILVDFIINNTDRHGANTELLKTQEKWTRLAPIFDNGASFVYSSGNNLKSIIASDPMYDYPAGNSIGSSSLFKNLNLIQQPIPVSPLTEKRRSFIFRDLSRVISRVHLDKIWEFIWRRYNYAKDKNFLLEKERFATHTGLFNV